MATPGRRDRVRIELDVRQGEVVVVVGTNGAGKSTLVDTIAGLHRAASGSIRMDGVDIATLPPHRVCDHGLAIVPEGRRIFPEMTVRDNLELGAYRGPARARRDGRRCAGSTSSSRGSPTAPASWPGSLSGGEQQMLAIGRALMADPRLLLLDEPSLGLAPIVVDEVFAVVRTINAAGVSVLLVEQNVQPALEFIEPRLSPVRRSHRARRQQCRAARQWRRPAHRARRLTGARRQGASRTAPDHGSWHDRSDA